MKHDILIPPLSDEGSPHVCVGYPDECSSLASFAQNLVVLAGGAGWYLPRPHEVNAILVDFASRSEDEANASLAGSWCASAGLALGAFSTIHTEEAINEQNERKSRHLTIIATDTDQDYFQYAVLNNVLDERSCPEEQCDTCRTRLRRGLADVAYSLAVGTQQSTVYLFSHWEPSPLLRFLLEHAEIELVHLPLSIIASDLLDNNRYYTTWYGTRLQAAVFRRKVWGSPPQISVSNGSQPPLQTLQ